MIDQTIDKKKSDMLILKSEKETTINFEAGNPFISDNRVRIELGKKDQVDFLPSRELLPITEVKEQYFNIPAETFSHELSKFPENPYLINNYGLALMNQKEWSDALEQFEKAIKFKKDFYSAKMNLARCLKNLNRIDEAYSVYKYLEKKFADNIDVRMNIASIHFIKREFDKAKTILEKVIKIDKRNEAAYNNRAVIYMIEGKFDLAISNLRKAISNNIYFAVAINNLGICYIALSAYKKALKYFYEALSIDSNNGDAVQNAVLTLHRFQRYQEATTLLENYLEKNRDDISVRELLAKSYLMMKKYVLSTHQLNLAIDIAKNKYSEEKLEIELSRFNNNFGVIHHQKGDRIKAREFYLKAKKELKTPSEILYRNIINLYFEIRRIDAAKNELEEAVKYFPENSHILFLYSRYFFEIQNFEKTVEFLKKIIEKTPDFLSSYGFLSFLYSEIYFNYDLAIEVLNKGLIYDKKNHSLLNNLAYNYLMKNNINKARIILDSIKDAEDTFFLTATRGLLLLKEGNLKEGTSLYNRAISLAQHDTYWHELIKQKKNLELSKFYYNKGRKFETEKYLKKLFNSKLESSIIYKQGKLFKKSFKRIQT